SDYGDAFVVAPDGSRAGLNWEVLQAHRLEEVCGYDPGRWGVWYVNFPYPLVSRENARKNLAHVLPGLREKWSAWRAEQSGGAEGAKSQTVTCHRAAPDRFPIGQVGRDTACKWANA